MEKLVLPIILLSCKKSINRLIYKAKALLSFKANCTSMKLVNYEALNLYFVINK